MFKAIDDMMDDLYVSKVEDDDDLVNNGDVEFYLEGNEDSSDDPEIIEDIVVFDIEKPSNEEKKTLRALLTRYLCFAFSK
jgi:hypothetical protein